MGRKKGGATGLWTCNKTAIRSPGLPFNNLQRIIHVITWISTHLSTPKGWKVQLAWLVDISDTLFRKRSHIDHRSGVNRGKSCQPKTEVLTLRQTTTIIITLTNAFVMKVTTNVIWFTLNFFKRHVNIEHFCSWRTFEIPVRSCSSQQTSFQYCYYEINRISISVKLFCKFVRLSQLHVLRTELCLHFMTENVGTKYNKHEQVDR